MLRSAEYCPLHRNRTCKCERKPARVPKIAHELKYRLIAPGTRLYPDGRIVRSKSALTKRKNDLLRTGNCCRACERAFTDYSDAELAHDNSKGAGGFKRDDSDANTFLLCAVTNREQGSLSWDTYSAQIRENGEKFPCEEM